MLGKTKTNFWLDLTILTTFLLTALTGLLLWVILPGGQGRGESMLLGLTRHQWIDLHSWIALAMLAGVTLHLTLHWKWIACVSHRYFNRLARQARINFSLNAVLFVAFFLANLSGLLLWLILPRGGFQGGRNPFYNATLLSLTRYQWQDLHLWAGLAMIVILINHLVLHWDWLVCVARRYAQAARCRSDECATA
jgi:hypothetical protein